MNSNRQPALSPPPTDSVPVRVKINSRDIVYMHAVIEAYDHLAVVRTIDKRNGILELLASPSFLDDLYAVLKGLGEEIPLEILERSDPING